jgi:hypothetical protein
MGAGLEGPMIPSSRNQNREKGVSKRQALGRFPSQMKLDAAKEKKMLADGCSLWSDTLDPDGRQVIALNKKNAERKLANMGVFCPNPIQIV